MSPKRILFAGVMACAFLVASCGGSRKAAPPKEATTAFPVPGAAVEVSLPAGAKTKPVARMLALLPQETIGIVYIPRIKDLGDGIERIAAATTPPKSRNRKPFSLAQFVQSLGLELTDFDLARPAAIAMTQPASAKAPPGVAAILPVRDEKTVVAKLKAISPRLNVEAVDGFVVLVEKGGYRRAGASPVMGADFPEADLVIRLDVAALWKTYSAQATASMAQGIRSTGREVPSAAVRSVIDTFTSIVEAATVCDVAIRIDGTAVETDTTLRFRNGAKIPALDVFSKSDLVALTRSVPDGGMVSFACAVDPEVMWSSVEPVATASLATCPEPARKVLRKAVESIGASLKSLGGGIAMTGSLDDGKIEWAGVVETSDPGAYQKTMTTMMSELRADGGPLTMSDPEERTVDGASVTTVRLSLAPEKKAVTITRTGTQKPRDPVDGILGVDVSYNLVALENKLLLVLGNDDFLKRTLKTSKADADAPPTALSKALAAAGPDAVGYFSIDLAGMMRGAAAIAARAGSPAAKKKPVSYGDDPTPLTFVLNRGKDEIRARVSIDVGKTAKIFMSMMR